MQIKNNNAKDVFNGDIGFIQDVDTENKALTVLYDGRSVEYDITELYELVQAYATTNYESQGSEYPVVVMPILMTHFIMLQRNLIYTGITRTKKLLVIIGSQKSLSYAVRNITVITHNANPRDRLQGL